MSEAAQMLKANLKLEGKPCGWCQRPLVLGEDAAVCTTCGREHHAGCWSERAGCCWEGCVNAPLKQLRAEALPQAQYQQPGYKICHMCRQQIPEMSEICSYCHAIVTPDGVYHGPKAAAPGAVASLVLGIIAVVLSCTSPITGTLALVFAAKAKERIRADVRLGGGGMATAGMVLGIISLVLCLLAFMVGFLGGAVGQ